MNSLLLLTLSAFAASSEPRMFYTMQDPQPRLVLADEKAVELKTISGFSRHQQWSPNGRLILLELPGEGHEKDLIAVMDMDLKMRQIKGQSNDFFAPGIDDPVWSADGRVVLGTDFNSGVVALGVDEESDTVFCPHPKGYFVGDVEPSPDGKLLAFTGYEEPFVSKRPNDVFVMGADCLKPVRLTTDGPQPFDLRWSRDSKRLAFVDFADNSGKYKLIIIDVDGKNRKEFKEASGHHSVSWGDDGKLLTTWADRTDPNSVMSYLGVLDPETGLVTVLRKGLKLGFGAAQWRPRPKKAAAKKKS